MRRHLLRRRAGRRHPRRGLGGFSGRYPRGIATEIERKFLVETPSESHDSDGVSIVQGYLAIDDEAEVRIRRAGDECTLTVKRGHGRNRDETEVDVSAETFELLWPATAGRRIEKVRRTVDLEDGLVAELDQYSGDLAGVSVVEVEFGSESDATRFSPPTWFGREVTGEPGWANQRLAVAGEPAKRAEYRVRPDEEPGSGVARVIAARTAQAAAAVRRADSSAAVADEVHEARKAIKKARSALRLLRGVISDDEREASNRGLRRAARSLSGARDAEVKLATLGTIGDFDPEPYGLTVWRIHLQGEAERHRGELSGPRLAEAGAAIEAVGGRYRGRRLPGAASRIAENAARGYRRGRRAMKDARGSFDPEGFHAWRKRAKDLRYQLEILGPRLPERFDEARAGAEGLADQLGELHDLDVLAADLSARPMDPVHRERLAEALAVARERLAQVCLERGKGLYREKPSRFAEGLAASLVGGS